MKSRGPRSALQSEIHSLLSRGKELAKQGMRRQAQSRFVRVLTLQPNHVGALLWLAALAQDPQQSVRYLNRVLEISPDNSAACAGLQWARKRLRVQPQLPPAAQRIQKAKSPWLDTLLLSGIAMIFVAACIILTLMAWRTPEAVRAAYRPTAMFTPTSTATLVPTYTLTPTVTPTPTLTQTPLPTATHTPPPTATATQVVSSRPSLATPLGNKWIDLDISEQTLRAYEGETLVFSALVSTGVPRMPTPLGEYKINRKVRVQAMGGPGYYLPNVQFVSYFYRGYAIHGTYWHNNFGRPMSHGCVNMRNADAQWIYNWAPIGIRVRVHR